MIYYILDGKKPVLCKDTETWAKFIHEPYSRTVTISQISKGVMVSTVFLGINHNFSGKGKPILFETMIFGGERSNEQYRYTTWEKAAKGHKKIVKELELQEGASSQNK